MPGKEQKQPDNLLVLLARKLEAARRGFIGGEGEVAVGPRDFKPRPPMFQQEVTVGSERIPLIAKVAELDRPVVSPPRTPNDLVAKTVTVELRRRGGTEKRAICFQDRSRLARMTADGVYVKPVASDGEEGRPRKKDVWERVELEMLAGGQDEATAYFQSLGATVRKIH